MRVLHGMSERANQAVWSVRGLRSKGCEAKSAVFIKNPYASSPDYSLGVDKGKKILYPWYALKMLAFAVFAVCRFDIFHFHAGTSLLPGNVDVALLRALGKRYYCEFHGSELRQGRAWTERNPYSSLLPEYGANPSLENRAKRVLKHASGVIVHDEELAQYLPDFTGPVYYVPLRIDLVDFIPSYPSVTACRPLIVHAPTDPRIKGTDYVKEVIDDLRDVYDFDFVLVEGKTQEEAKTLYSQADIIIDQLIIGSYGVFAVEAMALGKPVVTYIREDLKESFPPELPIIDANIDTLRNRLVPLLEDASLRNALGVAGRIYAEDYHDCIRVADILRNIYSGEKEPADVLDAFADVKSRGRDAVSMDERKI
ncbi:MAG: glycosyltransferase family 4 protein [Actinobacteria bacterium]|nr:glycosyltransferase family 4 protein [Actinomycetota bacterium]